MDPCMSFVVIALVLAVGLGIAIVASRLAHSGTPVTALSQPPVGRFSVCPNCDAGLLPDDRECVRCGLRLDSQRAGRLHRVRIARAEIRRLREDGELDPDTAARVVEQFDRRLDQLRHPERRPARPATPPPLPAEATPPPTPPTLPQLPSPVEERPTEPAPAPPVPEPVPAPAPRRSLAEVFAQFMHERNILWGELAGGLLIVGCSIALVLSLWRTLEELPYFTFLLCAGITAAVFGAGQYTLHHWKLTATSRGLLVIALLLTPLNLLLVADPGPRGTADWIDAVVKLAAVVAFAGLVRTAGRDLVGTDQLPGAVPRRWLLALAVVGAPASQIVPALADLGPLAYQPAWLPLLCFVIASGMAVARLSRDHRSTEAEPLGERAGTALLLFVGLGLFALFAAWGFLLTRTDDLAAALRQLAFPVVVAGVPVLSAGLLVQRRVVEPPGLRATGTGVALAGVIVMFASLVLAWPDPLALFLASAAVAVTLGWVAYRDAVAWMYLGAIP